MKVLVSACILGCNCKYNGKSNYNEKVTNYLKDYEIVRICPEILAGLPIPRPCAEIVNGLITEESGRNADEQYRHGIDIALKQLEGLSIDFAILQSRSPTCGVNQIYDGTFTGKLIPGQGLFAKALIERNIKVVDVSDFIGN